MKLRRSMIRRASAAALLLGGALALALAAPASGPAHAQVGAVMASPKIEGLQEGQGAPFPKGHYTELNALPDWGGVWTYSFPRPQPGAAVPVPGPPPPPALKGKYLEGYQTWRKGVVANNGVAPKNGSNCLPPGLPGIMTVGQYPLEFLFTPGRVTINAEAWMQTRKVFTDGRPHPEDPEPGFYGHSIGHWEGDTLVVDTIAIKDSVLLSMGAAHSDKMRVSERIHLSPTDPDMLLDEITVTDPEALEKPYTNVATYKRDRWGTLLEFVCAENDRNPVDEHGNTHFE